MEQSKLDEILRLHALWLKGDKTGIRADLTWANLYGANLTGANLYGANLYGANLTGATSNGEIIKHLKSILGLDWPILIFNDQVKVGRQSHTYLEWQNMTDRQIAEMHDDAPTFYPILMSILKHIYKE